MVSEDGEMDSAVAVASDSGGSDDGNQESQDQIAKTESLTLSPSTKTDPTVNNSTTLSKPKKPTNALFPIGMCTDRRIEFILELLPLKTLAKHASRARKEKSKLQEKLNKGDACLSVYSPWTRKVKEVGCM